MRVVPNLYPAFEGDEPFVVANRGPVFTQASAGGIHEILIFSPEHDTTWGMLSEEQTSLVMAALATASRSTPNGPTCATPRPS